MFRTYETRRAATLAVIPLGAVLIVMATSCHGDAVGPVPEVTAVRVSGMPSDGVLFVGDTLRLSASTTDVAGQDRLDSPVAWSTSNPGVATVSTRGTVSGVSAGTAIIKATSGPVSASTVVTVRATIIPPSAAATAPVVQSVLGGKVTLSIPPGAVPAGVTRLSVGPSSAPPASTELLSGTAFDFGPSGTRFASPLRLTLTFDPASFPAAARAGLAIYHVVGDDYEEVLNSVVDNTTNAVSAPIFGFSSYAILRRAAPASVVVSDGGGDGQGGAAGSPMKVRPAVRVLDARGRPVAFVDVTFSVTSGGGSLTGATQVTDRNGIATVGSWTLGPKNGANSLLATVAGLPPVAFTASGVVQVPAWLVITGQPVSSPAGSLPAVVVSVRDANNAVTPLFTGPVTIALRANPTNAVLGGTRTVNAVAGIATFADLTLNEPGKGYTLVASATSLAGVISNAFDIVAGPPRSLQFDAYPRTGGVSGTDLSPITVVVHDALGNVSTGFAGSVSLSLASAPVGATLQGVTTVNATAGVAQFSHARVNVPGLYRIQAMSSGLPSVIGQEFIVNTPSTGPTLSVVSGSGQSGHSGATLPLPIVVQLNANGHPVVGQTVTFAIASGGGQVSPTSAVTNSLGQASTSWTLGGATGVQTMTVATTSSPPITIFAAANTGLHLSVKQQPAATQAAGSIVTPPFIVEMRDDNDAVVPSFTGAVSLSIGVNPGGSTLAGTTVVGAVGGVATFDAFKLDRPGNGYTVVATSAPYSVSSSAFNVLEPGATTANVTVSTTGTELPTALRFLVEDCPVSFDSCYLTQSFQVAPNASFAISVGQGRHNFYVADVPLNCLVASPQQVTATPGVPLSVSFNLTCFRSGTVRVTAPTSGTDPASYYNILVDGTWAAFVMAGSSASFKAREGSRSVQLIDVPGNCTVTSSNPATVIVVGGGMTDVSFPVSCVANPTLTVTVTTTGTHIPAEFYVGVDYYYYYYYYQYSFTVSANGSGSIRIPPGDHTVYLDGLPGNCAVTSANGISVAMVLGSTRNVSFTVVCH